jgi:hypothetical protein
MKKNVLGNELQTCSLDPLTGAKRDGYCSYDKRDPGLHIVAAQVTQEFLEYNKARGNDLITPKPGWQFPGLKAGDWWCICMGVWLKSKDAGHPLYINLEACDEKVLEYISLDELKEWDYKNKS